MSRRHCLPPSSEEEVTPTRIFGNPHWIIRTRRWRRGRGGGVRDERAQVEENIWWRKKRKLKETPPNILLSLQSNTPPPPPPIPPPAPPLPPQQQGFSPPTESEMEDMSPEQGDGQKKKGKC